MITHLTPQEAAELRGIVCALIAQRPATPEPIILGIGILLKFDAKDPENSDCVFLELWDGPRVRAFCLSADNWHPWAKGWWTFPPVEVAAWHVQGTLKTWGTA